MKFRLVLFLFCLMAYALQAQVRCTLAAGPVGADGKLSAQLTVAIEPGWHIASLTQLDGGPVRTVIALADGQPFKLAGLIKGPKPHVEPSEAFGVDVETYEGTVTFVLPLEATGDVPFDGFDKLTAGKARARPLVVEITYQACTDETCLLPKTDRVSCEIGERKPESG